MTVYRVFTLGENRMVMRAKIIEARTDAAALDVARDFMTDRDLEVWTGRRCVGLLQA